MTIKTGLVLFFYYKAFLTAMCILATNIYLFSQLTPFSSKR